jgi:hypothetical protein
MIQDNLALPPVAEPTWMVLLRGAVERAPSMQAVAEQIGYSRTTVSLVLAGKYGKSTEAIALAVMTLLDQVICPVLGDLPGPDCLRNQNAPFSAANPQRVALYRACRAGCPHSRLERTS